MLQRTPATDDSAAVAPAASSPPVIVLHGLSPCGHRSTVALYCSLEEVDAAVESFTDEGWTFTRREVRA